MTNINECLNKIKSATFGKDVRNSIHDAIEECYNTASVDHDNANMEVKKARGGYLTLEERLNEENLKLGTEIQIERKRIDLLTKIENGETTGNTELLDVRIGADGIIYNSAGNAVREQFKKIKTKTDNNLKDIKESIKFNCNLFDEDLCVQGSIKSEDGTLTEKDDTSRLCTDFIPIVSNEEIQTNIVNLTTVRPIDFVFYDKDKNFIKTISCDEEGKCITPTNASYVRTNIKAQSFKIDNIDKISIKLTKDFVNYMNTNLKDIKESMFQDSFLDSIEVKVADFLNDNTTDDVAIKQAIDFSKIARKRTIIFNNKDWEISEAILLPSNTTVKIDGCTIKQKNETFDNVFRGDNLILDKNNPNGACLSCEKLENIKILGFNNAQIIGCDVNKKGTHVHLGEQDMTGDFWGWRTLQISISMCKGLEISGISLSKTRCWAISLDKVTNFYIHDININSNVKNGDGIDLRAGCKNGKVENINGKTSDDTVACTALNIPNVYPDGNYMYPMEPTQSLNENLSNDDLNIENVEIQNIFTSGNHHGVICLANYGVKVRNIYINNVEDKIPSSRESMVKIYSGYGSGYNDNDLNNIRVNNIISNGAKYAVQITHKVGNVWCNNIKQNKAGNSLTSVANNEGVTITNS